MPTISKFKTLLYICTMKNQILLGAAVAAIALSSCGGVGGGSSAKLEGKWQAVGITAPGEDSMMQEQMKMYTAQVEGMKEVDPQMAKQFGTSNLDSAKAMMRAQIAAMPEQISKNKEESVKNFNFTLQSNGVALQTAKEGIDSAAWYTAKKDELLVLDPIAMKREGNLLVFKIIYSSKDSLSLSPYQTGAEKTVIAMKKEAKK